MHSGTSAHSGRHVEAQRETKVAAEHGAAVGFCQC